MKNFNTILGSGVNLIITTIAFLILSLIFGEIVKPALISVFISYPLTGWILRKLGIWGY